jgi:NTE family protein
MPHQVQQSCIEDIAVGRRLSSVPLLRALDGPSLAALDAELKWVRVPGGQTLFRENDVADALYVVMSGCLGVSVSDGHGRDTLVSRIVAGETVGEMGILDGGFRSATVEALRDTELLRLDKSSCERLVEQYPRSMLSLMSLLVRRLRNTTRHLDDRAQVRTVALVSTDHHADHRRVAHDLVNRLVADGQRALLLDCKSTNRSTEWLSAAEAANDLVVYCAEPANPDWTKLCLRQADRVLLVASCGAPLTMPTWLAEEGKDCRRPFDLVVIRQGRNIGRAVECWRAHLPIDVVCQVRHGNPNDIARLLRLLRGTAVGLVLSAGGARGFAHLGVVRALREAHIPIDRIGGCSMGAIVGAAVAMEWDDAEIRERLRSAFVESNPINDYTLPFLSLVKGHKVTRRLEEHFGNICIEDLWRPFFCVSTNLSAGVLAVHRDGTLVRALRASVAIPGLLPPVMIDREAHVDGGVMNWLPVDVMGSKRGPVIAVDAASDPALVSFEGHSGTQPDWRLWRRWGKMPPIVDLLFRAATVSSDALGRAARGQADILFKPALETIDLLDWKACDRAIDAGYRHAIEKLEQRDKSMTHWQWWPTERAVAGGASEGGSLHPSYQLDVERC